MVVDTSALFAVLAREPERSAFENIIDESTVALCSAVSLVELSIVASGRFRRDMRQIIDLLFAKLGLEIVFVDADLAHAAIEAHLSFGKGRHPAQLNLGDCFSYALAKSRNLPLLFKGDDFPRTDIVPAWRP